MLWRTGRPTCRSKRCKAFRDPRRSVEGHAYVGAQTAGPVPGSVRRSLAKGRPGSRRAA
jgi:hypothetical protein